MKYSSAENTYITAGVFIGPYAINLSSCQIYYKQCSSKFVSRKGVESFFNESNFSMSALKVDLEFVE